MNLHCERTSCNNNTGVTHKCMYGVDANLIKYAKSGRAMCDLLRKKILELEKEFREVFENERNKT